MNVLINSDEWLAPWVNELVTAQIQQTANIKWDQTSEYVKSCQAEFKKTGLITINFGHVNYLLGKDLQAFRNEINQQYKIAFKEHKPSILEKIQELGVSEQEIISKYLSATSNAFAKSIAPQLSEELNWIIHESQANWSKPFFIRNIVNNESLLRRCLTEKLNFWFVDTGYTNFLHKKQKVWHRLVQNNIHHDGTIQDYPDDRLCLLSNLPTKWRRKGSTILVVESSPEHYAMRGTTLSAWRKNVEKSIQEFSGRPIEFRPKNTDRKTRESVYNLLLETKEYYCVVSDSSAAAIEAIWTGTPVITLGRHITNSVSRRSLEHIDHLYRGDLEPWFNMLSYNQFTFEELCNGTAVSIIKKYNNV